MQVQELERALFERFPAEHAEAWDHVGLSVGDPAACVRGVTVALDATRANVLQAAQQGSNVLLTHHPVYIKAPDAFTPPAPAHASSGSAVYEAVRQGVSIISLHTNLDRSIEARELLPALVGLTAASSLELPGDPAAPGLGSLCDTAPCTAQQLAVRCAAAFGTQPRVWDAGAPISRIAFLGGSLGDLGEAALAAGDQAVVTGEAGYHVCQDLALRGCSVILLGHDRSEDPFRAILMDAAEACGVARAHIATIVTPQQWTTVTEGERA